MKKLLSRIEHSKYTQSVLKAVKSYTFAKIIFIAGIWIVNFIPVYFYFFIRWLVDPIGFWQEFALLLIVTFAIGWVQVLLLMFAIGLTAVIISDEI